MNARRMSALIGSLLLAVGAGATQGPDEAISTLPPRLEAAVSPGAFRGLGPDDVVGGAVRIELPGDEPPTLELADLRLDPDRLPPPESVGRRPAADGGCFLISPLEHAGTNRLGGGFSSFARSPARARAELAAVGGGRRALRFSFVGADESWAGLAIDLFEPDPEPRSVHYLDARDYATLVFRVRLPAPALVVGVADAAWRDRGDARDIAPLEELLDPAAGSDWAWARIRLAELPDDLDRSRLARLVLQADQPHGEVAVDDLMLCRAGADPERAATLPPVREGREPVRALWVWSTRRVAEPAGELPALLELVERTGIDRVYLQLPGEFLDRDRNFDPAEDAAILPPLLGALRRAGVEAYALDGAPELALPDARPALIAAVRRVAAFNAAAGAERAFDGIHLDVEPYLLEEWDGAGRDGVVESYLDMLEGVHEAAGMAGLPLEAAIPFWFDGVPAPPARSPGGFRPLSDVVLERVDTVVVMDYRTTAEGGNGTVALAEAELDRASRVGRQVLVALETGELPDAELLRFRGRGRPGPPPDTGTWIVLGGGESPRIALVRDGAWPGIADSAVADGPVRHWPVAQRILQPAARLTFHGADADALEAVISRTEEALRRYPAFAGIAIHHYDSYRRLLDHAGPGMEGAEP